MMSRIGVRGVCVETGGLGGAHAERIVDAGHYDDLERRDQVFRSRGLAQRDSSGDAAAPGAAGCRAFSHSRIECAAASLLLAAAFHPDRAASR
jgi:hypothetical protein